MKNGLVIFAILFAAVSGFAKADSASAVKRSTAAAKSISTGLSSLMIKELEKDTQFNAGLGQGWQAYAAAIRCYDPQGTDNPSDKPYCLIEKLK